MTAVDVAVVGGGLAGCAAAIRLAQLGWQVALFEAKRYPQDKVCGEFLSPESTLFLDMLGMMPGLRQLKPKPLQEAAILAPSGERWQARFPMPGLGLSRRALDAALAERARAVGARVHEETTVTALDGTLIEGFHLSARTPAGEQVWAARAVVGAHGKRSVVDRALNRALLRERRGFVGLKMHFDGPPLGRVELHAFPGGYCGLSDIEGGRANACLLVRQDVFRRMGGQVESFIRWMRAQNRFLDDWMRRAIPLSNRWLAIAGIQFARKPAVERDVLMAGDSAGLLAPLAGDGMAMALQAGLLAASHLDGFLGGSVSASDLCAAYRADWNRRFRERLRYGNLLQAVLLRPALLGPALRVLSAAPWLGDFFVARTRDPVYTEGAP